MFQVIVIVSTPLTRLLLIARVITALKALIEVSVAIARTRSCSA